MLRPYRNFDALLRLQDQRVHRRLLDIDLIPQHRVVLDVAPAIRHVAVMWAGRMTALPRRLNPLALVEIAQVNDHPHG